MTERVAYSRADINGGASPSRLASGINASAVSFAIGSGEQASWPTGSDGKFLVCFDRGQANEEKAWVASRSGVNCSIDDVGDRGADDTSAAAHDADATVEVVIGAVHIDEANKLVSELAAKATTAGQIPYVTAAQAYAMLAIGASARIMVSTGSAPSWVAMSGDVTINASGVATIGASKITNGMMADDAIDSAEIADGAIDTVHIGDLQVTTGKLAASSVTAAKLDAGQTDLNDTVITAAAKGDTITHDGTNWVDKPGGFGRCAIYTRATNQSALDSTDTEVIFTAEQIDDGTGSSFSTSTVTFGLTGLWLVSGSVLWAANATGMRRSLLIVANAVTTPALPLANVVASPGAGATAVAETGVHLVKATGGSTTLQLQVRQDSGGALNVTAAKLQLVYLGALW